MSEQSTAVKHVAILGGGGLMGHGIALACLQSSDVQVTIISRREESVNRGLNLIETSPYGLKKAVSRGKITTDDAEAMMARVRGTTSYKEGLEGVDLVFESVPEVVSTKQQLLAEMEKYVGKNTVFATNTSSIMISELAAQMENPGRMVGAHWFYPSNIMPLVEVARSELTDPSALALVQRYLKHIGKKIVTANDAPGFFMTRFVNNFIAEAIRSVELGIVGPSEIDEMVKAGLGWPMGVFELLDDTASFDSFYHAQEYLFETCGERYAIPPLARKVFKAGYLGSPKLKPGSRGGWYDFLGVGRDDAKK